MPTMASCRAVLSGKFRPQLNLVSGIIDTDVSSDLESGPFVEALVQLRHELTRDPDSSFFNIHVSFVPLFVATRIPLNLDCWGVF